MVYYRYLFRNMKSLSPNEGLVYSALLSHSLMTSENFDIDGNFSTEYAKAFVRDNIDIYGVECLAYNPISTRRLAKTLNVSENTVRRIKEDLKHKHHLLNDTLILCPLELLDGGYLDISPNVELKGLQLVFYGLLKDRSSQLHGTIDTWAVRLAELMGLNNKKVIYNLLAILHKKGLVKRLENGKLKVK